MGGIGHHARWSCHVFEDSVGASDFEGECYAYRDVVVMFVKMLEGGGILLVEDTMGVLMLPLRKNVGYGRVGCSSKRCRSL